MANNNKQNIEITYTDFLKAQFSRQYYPQLKQFLEKFDISEEVKDGNKKYRDSLGMHFLLDNYDEKKESDREKLKKNCFWEIDDIEDRDLINAVEEFFYITKKRLKANDSEEKRNTLLEKLFNLGIKENDQSTIGDTIMFKIADYFGVRGNQDKLGNLYFPFIAFLKKAEIAEDSGLYQFHNALRLFSSIRNNTIHNEKYYKGERLKNYHQFILFTYIGYVYVCRRVWRTLNNKSFFYEPQLKANSKKQRSENVAIEIALSDNAQSFKIKPDKVEIFIEQGSHNLKKIVFQQEGQGKREIKTSGILEIYKYVPFSIIIECDNNTYPYNDVLDYYSWFYRYKIILPDTVSPSYKENSMFSEGMNELINRVTSAIKNSLNDDIKDALKLELSSLEPLLQDIRNNEGDSKLCKSVSRILERLAVIGEDSSYVEKEIENVHLDIKELHDKTLGRLDEFSDSFYDLKEKNKIIVEKVDTLIEFAKQNRRFLWTATSVIGLGFVCCILFNFDSLQSSVLSSFKILVIIILIVSSYCLYRQSKPLGFIKGKLTRLIALGLIVLFSWFGLKCAIDTGREFFVNHCYDFAEKDPERNQEVANLMESILESNPNDEETRIKLTRYYLDYANDAEKAFIIASPMLDDIEKHPRGILAIIEALYSQGKDFWKVRDLLESYKKTIDCDSNVVNRIEGIMNVWGQGQTSDIAKGYDLLRLSADNGDPEAQYYLGYALSHEMTDWEKPRKNSVGFTGCNLIEAIEYLRKASSVKPKAALELGQLYADLNMKDSALFYFNHALCHSKGELYKASLYRLGLLFKDIDSIKSNTYMMKAALLDYEPAILYKAIHSKDHKASIELYNTPQAYKGYKTIIPVVFEYLAIGQKNNALKALYEARPYGKFNQDFMLGMETMLGSPQRERDSVAAMSYMKASAKQGCLYAEMICLYRNMEQYAQKGIIIQSKVDSLSEIGETIPFANILISDLMQHSGRYYESINQIEYARKEYQIAEDAALKAFYYGHPASIKMLGDMRLAGFKFQYGIPLKNLSDYKKELSKHNFMLRFNEKKFYSIASGYIFERIIYNRWGSNRDYEMPNKDFWINIVIANHHFEGECALLTDVSNDEDLYLTRLINAALNDMTISSDSGAISHLQFRINVLSAKPRYEKWISELKNKYKGDPLKKIVFNECDISKMENTKTSICFSWLNKKVVIDDRSLLNELSDNNDVDGRMYDKPF